MAVGLARMMNIHFPQNFNSPYKATSITDFWQRWHITLSQWLRDYLYIPLGGNRLGKVLTYRNLFLTMLLGGLWHGAHWVFIVWGAYHGVLLALERVVKSTPFESLFKRIPRSIKQAWTFFLVVIGWVFFRSPDLEFAHHWIKQLFQYPVSTTLYFFEPQFRDRFYVALALAAVLSFFTKNTSEIHLPSWSTTRMAWLMALLMVTCLAFFSKSSPFLYFQF